MLLVDKMRLGSCNHPDLPPKFTTQHPIARINLKVAVMDTDYYALQSINSYLAWDRRWAGRQKALRYSDSVIRINSPVHRITFYCFLKHPAWIIESVAVIVEMRGKGMVKPLMTALLDQGQRLGHTHAGITIANSNERARRAYERMGFQIYLAFGPAFFGEEGFGGYTKYRLTLA